MAIVGQYTANGSIIRASDGVVIPPDPANRDYQAALAAVAGGDTITAYAPPAPSRADVDAERERRIALPLTVTTSAGSIAIDMDGDSQRNLNGLATAGLMLKAASSTQTTAFRDHDNAMHDLTPDDLISMGSQVMARISAVYADSWAIKALSPIPADYAADGRWP